jgi:capsular polysaccharide biosynthesis protein
MEIVEFSEAHPEISVTAFGVDWPSSLFDISNLKILRGRNFRAVHSFLSRWGPVDLLVEGPHTHAEQVLTPRLLWHVRSGGKYLISRTPSLLALNPQTSTADVVSALLRAATGMDPDPEQSQGMLDSINEVVVSDSYITLVRAGDAAIKFRHSELDLVLRPSRKAGWYRVIRVVPPSDLDSSAVLGTHNDQDLSRRLFRQVINTPELKIREYEGVTAHPHGILLRDNYILPDSFRLWMSGRLRHRQLHDYGQYFVRPLDQSQPSARLGGQYYNLCLEHPTHFGHFMIDGLARLWGWHWAKKRNPDLKLLVGALRPFQDEILRAFGIASEDVVVTGKPVQVESMVSAMPSYCVGRYISEKIRKTYHRLQQGIEIVDSPGGELIFLSRTPGLWRECVNAPVVEEFFMSRGFSVHRPELHTVAQQAALFRRARVVAGYIGSQFCGQLFAPSPLQLIGFTNRSYTSSNEFMMAAVLGHTLHQFWGVTPAAQREVDILGRPVRGAHQDYAFDVDRDLATLRRLVDGLTARAS